MKFQPPPPPPHPNLSRGLTLCGPIGEHHSPHPNPPTKICFLQKSLVHDWSHQKPSIKKSKNVIFTKNTYWNKSLTSFRLLDIFYIKKGVFWGIFKFVLTSAETSRQKWHRIDFAIHKVPIIPLAPFQVIWTFVKHVATIYVQQSHSIGDIFMWL